MTVMKWLGIVEAPFASGSDPRALAVESVAYGIGTCLVLSGLGIDAPFYRFRASVLRYRWSMMLQSPHLIPPKTSALASAVFDLGDSFHCVHCSSHSLRRMIQIGPWRRPCCHVAAGDEVGEGDPSESSFRHTALPSGLHHGVRPVAWPFRLPCTLPAPFQDHSGSGCSLGHGCFADQDIPCWHPLCLGCVVELGSTATRAL